MKNEDPKLKAEHYKVLMDIYTKLENDKRAVPKLSLEEQMKVTDVTGGNGSYSPENLEKINEINKKMVRVQAEAQKLQMNQ